MAMKQGLTAPLRDDESGNRGYDVFAMSNDLDFDSMGGFVSELRFAVRGEVLEDKGSGKELGHMVTDSPGDPKVVTLRQPWSSPPRMPMQVREAVLIGSSRAYRAKHGEDADEHILSEAALERRKRIVMEVAEILERSLTRAGDDKIDRLRSSSSQNISVDLSGLENKLGMGSGTKTFKGGENLLNEEQEAFVRKRDRYLAELEALIIADLTPKLVSRGILSEGEKLAISFHNNGGDALAVDINMPTSWLQERMN